MSNGEIPARVDVAVVGAGLAGLACARVTADAGLHTVVLEASDGVGGRVRTDLVDGYRLDRGFQILLTAYPEAHRQLDLHALDLHAFDPGAVVHLDGGFHRIADPLRRPSGVVPTLRAPVGSLVDKVRIGLLRTKVARGDGSAILRRADRSTLDELEADGFGPDMIERFFRPLIGGIQLDPTLESSGRMFQLVFRALALGDAALPALGMQAIPDQLASRLPDGCVVLGAPVERVLDGRVELADGRRCTASAVVVATNGDVAAKLVDLPDPGSKPVSCVWFGADESPQHVRSIILDGSGSGPATNVAMVSEVAPLYAPAGRAVIAAACPGTDEIGLEADVREQLRDWFGAVVNTWDVLKVDHIGHGQPFAPPGFDPKQGVRLGNGTYVTGDHRDTPSIQGALYSGRRCGEAVCTDLGTRAIEPDAATESERASAPGANHPSRGGD